MILYVTSFNKKLYEATGKDMLESFVYVKTEGEILVTYEDDITIPKHRKFIPYNLDTDDFLNNWLEENKDVIPKSIGGNFEGSMSKYNARASKWFRKIAALNKALEYKDRYEAIVFVDSDTTFKNKITEEYVLSVFDNSAMFYHLGQYRKHIDAGIESGFIGFHMKNGGDEFLRRTIKKFQDKESDVRFFVSNPQTGGMGITLHAATNVIYYSNDFNLESRKQSEDRAHRVGQHHPVLYVDLMCPKTVDVHIVKTLLSKNKLANITLGERVLEWLKV